MTADQWPTGFCYTENFLSDDEADRLLTQWQQELDWKQQDIVIFGRSVAQPRLTCWYADPHVKYSYSGLELKPKAWPPSVQTLRERLGAHCAGTFNSVLCNAYRDGQDSMGWHADNEPELGPAPTIASLSLGSERMFRVRRPSGGTSRGFVLHHGSLLVMKGDSQRNFQHAISKTKKQVGMRINLTFRKII